MVKYGQMFVGFLIKGKPRTPAFRNTNTLTNCNQGTGANSIPSVPVDEMRSKLINQEAMSFTTK